MVGSGSPEFPHPPKRNAAAAPWGTYVGRRLLLVSAAVGSVVLVVYGGVLVLGSCSPT